MLNTLVDECSYTQVCLFYKCAQCEGPVERLEAYCNNCGQHVFVQPDSLSAKTHVV